MTDLDEIGKKAYEKINVAILQYVNNHLDELMPQIDMSRLPAIVRPFISKGLIRQLMKYVQSGIMKDIPDGLAVEIGMIVKNIDKDDVVVDVDYKININDLKLKELK